MAYPQIITDFLELVTTPSHSYKERILADLFKLKLKELDLDLEIEEDQVGAAIGGDTGNIIVRWPGQENIIPILFSAHLDRVSNPGHITPIVKENEDRIVSDGATILGADDASGLAAILDGFRRVKAEGIPHGDIELLITVAEEVGLKGSRNLNYTKVKSKIGYVLDSSGPVGTIVNRAPTQKTVEITIHGRSAHAGMAPEEGINAIRVGALAIASLPEGRLSPITTSNFGVISGGKATNIVCDLVKIKAEARSHDQTELEAYVTKLEEAFKRFSSEAGATVSFDWTVEYNAFYAKENEKVVTLASSALKNLGLDPKIISGGGGMDANHFNEHGIKSVGLSTGYKFVHTEKEEQPISELILCGKVVAEIIRTIVNS
ncbi:MAG: M20/M25/M40 family metallo-hydrolase [Deltaproteobacteria bacterium]|nr:M20/M25/M40 family metallo-hydrolase [Deltaproteobacteria bacterium]